ncbi:retroviral-like aspartic protease family protein [Candidatus Korobacter versatilis]|nr:retroviral-like aspartic protease family protein [Candidatus Koribacter versatilis]
MEKRRSYRVIAGLVMLAVVAAVGALLAQVHNHASLPDPVVELARDSMTLPLTTVGGRPIVQVRVNGSGPYPFILDTGAEGTLITMALANELKLPISGEVKVASPGAAEPASAEMVQIAKIELGDVKMTGVTGVALDLSSMPKIFSGADAPMGVLSIRGWKGFLVTVDYPANRITVKRGQLATADNVTIYQFSATDRLPTVSVDFAGTAVRANVDTGAGRGIVLPRSLQSKLPLEAAPVPTESLHTVSGEQAASRAQLKGAMKLGGYSIQGPQLDFVDEFPMGNLGYPILKNFAVTVDWQSHRVELKQSAPPA